MDLIQAPFALFLTLLLVASASPPPDEKAFLRCLVKRDTAMSSIIYTPKNTTFLKALDFLIQNSRFTSPETPKPKAILIPFKESQIQTAIYCGKRHHLEMRVRSGGHDFEGSSYTSEVPFFVLDMFNFRSISVDPESKTAWVGAGATIGEAYYGINEKNSSLAFPGGFWPTLGVGGHISGGGYGPLVRQYGLAADNVLDAGIIDVNGRILDRKSMGEDLFWAIRGGVGSNFAVILSFKLRLVEVPRVVSGFHIKRTLEQNAIQIVHKWQQVGPKLPLELSLTVQLTSIVSTDTGKRTIQAEFITVYRGSVSELISIMGQYFPELGLNKEDCEEILWIESYPFLLGQPIDNLNVKDFLTNRASLGELPSFKWKVDFAKDPIPPEGLAKILNELFKIPPLAAQLGWTILGGGAMDRIPESQVPFPHRGRLMIMREIVFWKKNDTATSIQTRLSWMKQLHGLIGRYVPDNPRAAYADYRDLDLGVNNIDGDTSIQQAIIWGFPYFKNNFDRLVKVKTLVDPQNFFKNEQSFPPVKRH